jgi:putative DNA primase/helicase
MNEIDMNISYKFANAQEIISDYWPDGVEKNGQYKILDTTSNIEWLLKKYHIIVRYNEMSKKREIVFPSKDYFFSYNDIENTSLSTIEELATHELFPYKKSIDAHLDQIGHKNAYHPITQLIKNNPWDGVKRLDYFINLVKSPSANYAADVIRTWMVAAIAAAHTTTGFLNDGVLVFQGPQGIGKTTWVRNLDPIKCNAIKEGFFLDPSDKEKVYQAAGYWILELGELDAVFKKSDIGRLKSYITTQSDQLRRAYARKDLIIPRRTVYVATVNDAEYLVDTTGNRRWWTIPITEIIQDPTIDMTQVWAEVYTLWVNGHQTYLPKEIQEKINLQNKAHEKADPIYDLLRDKYDWASSYRRRLSATAVLIELGFNKPTMGELKRINHFLKQINGKEPTIRHGYSVHEIPQFIYNHYQK